MTKRKLSAWLGVVALLLSGSVQAESQTDPVNEAAETRQESKETAEGSIGQKAEEYADAVKEKLTEFGARLKSLEERAKEVGGKAKAGVQESIKELRKKMATADQEWETFKAASAEAWEKAKPKLDAAMHELQRYYDQLTERLKKSTEEEQS